MSGEAVESILSAVATQQDMGAIGKRPRDVVHIHNQSQVEELRQLDIRAASATLVAFDAEWWHVVGEDAGVHVLQLAFPDGCVYVLQVNNRPPLRQTCTWKELFSRQDDPPLGIPPAVCSMLQRPSCTVVGWGVAKDLIRLLRTSPLLLKSFSSKDVVDIQMLAGATINLDRYAVKNNKGSFGPRLDDAAEALLGEPMAKDTEITMSNWSATELSAEQVKYAVEDVWITLRLYKLLAQRSVQSMSRSAPTNRTGNDEPVVQGEKRALVGITCDRCGLKGMTSETVLQDHRGSNGCLTRARLA